MAQRGNNYLRCLLLKSLDKSTIFRGMYYSISEKSNLIIKKYRSMNHTNLLQIDYHGNTEFLSALASSYNVRFLKYT